jgi:hypothetical protein
LEGLVSDAYAIRVNDVRDASDLPRSLFLGLRDDESFARRNGVLECSYRFEELPFLRVEARDGGWFLTRYSPTGDVHSISFGKDVLSNALQQLGHSVAVEGGQDPWERYFKNRIESVGRVLFAVNSPRTEPGMVFFPDGIFKYVIAPLGQWCAEGAYERAEAWSAEEFGTHLNLVEGVRRFEFFRTNPMPAGFGDEMFARIAAAHRKPGGSWRASRDVYPPAEVQVHHVQVLQPATFLVCAVALRNALSLMHHLRSVGLVASREADALVATSFVFDYGDLVIGRTAHTSVGDLSAEPERVMFEAYLPSFPPESYLSSS